LATIFTTRLVTGACACCLAAVVPGAFAATGAVDGRVADDDGAPLAGVRLGISSSECAPCAAPTLTGADGGFRFEGLPRGSYTVRADHPGFISVDWQQIRVRPRRTTAVAIWMPTAPAFETAAEASPPKPFESSPARGDIGNRAIEP
jgi:hypothetical protein